MASIETGTANEVGTSYDPPAESSINTTERLVKIFEREILLGSNIKNHIPDYIMAGLEQLRSV